jgi:F-type H+-transporting ATPase subunit epsilon
MTQERILKVKIVTPEKSIFSSQADMIVLPGDEGEIGLLPAHIPLITMLKEGILKLYNRNQITSQIIVSKGYGQIFNDELLILTEFALDLAEADIDKIKKNVESLRDKLDRTQNADNRNIILQDLSRNQLILDYTQKT